jgi:glucokinase
MPKNFVIGVDLGGTKIAFAAVTQTGDILATHTLPTHAEQGADAVIKRIVDGIQYLSAELDDTPTAIGIGCPSPIDSANGILIHSANLGWRDFPLNATLNQSLPFDIPVYIENDVNAEALGELHFGAARGQQNFIYLAIGTGVGGCAVINGQVIGGTTFCAMEVGHISIDPAGRPCTCGRIGCVEMYVSGKAFHTAAQEYLPDYPRSSLTQIEDFSTNDILQAARDGDSLALRIIDEGAEALGIVLAWCAMILNPPLCILSGGLGQAAADLLLDKAHAAFQKRAFPEAVQTLRIVHPQIETSALGAAALAWHHFTTNP